MKTFKRSTGAVLLLVALVLSLNVSFCQVAQAARSVSAGNWTLTGSMKVGRILHTMTLLKNGNVLVVGGQESSSVPVRSAELYDPRTGRWTLTGSMSVPRDAQTATLLSNGTPWSLEGIRAGLATRSRLRNSTALARAGGL